MIRIKPSKRNTNKHTEKGMELLSTSIDEDNHFRTRTKGEV